MSEVLYYDIPCWAFSPDGLDEADTGGIACFLEALKIETRDTLIPSIAEIVEHGDKALIITTKRALTEDEENMLRKTSYDFDYTGGVEFKTAA